MRKETLPTTGLYIHIPYCVRKCGYCDFNSHPEKPEEMAAYLRALLREMEFYARGELAGARIATIFFGGGTPTVFPVAYLEEILAVCGRLFSLASASEITVEANPATIGRAGLRRLRRAGCNRLSIGAQSFRAPELAFLERIHGAGEIARTVQSARAAGFDNLSLDLMFGLPGQTRTDWGRSLARAAELAPEHISAYNLTIEAGTPFAGYQARGRWRMPEEDLQLRLYKDTIGFLRAAGYRQYEISNFARRGRECRHNLNYWDNGEYLGLGAGASSFFGGVRRKNWSPPAQYIDAVTRLGQAVEFRETPDAATRMAETLMLGLRLSRGVSLKRFNERFQTPLTQAYKRVLPPLVQRGFLSLRRNRLALSKKGLYVANNVILEFFP